MKTKAEKICAFIARMTVPTVFIGGYLQDHCVKHQFLWAEWDEYTMADGSVIRWDDSGFNPL